MGVFDYIKNFISPTEEQEIMDAKKQCDELMKQAKKQCDELMAQAIIAADKRKTEGAQATQVTTEAAPQGAVATHAEGGKKRGGKKSTTNKKKQSKTKKSRTKKSMFNILSTRL